MKKYSEGIMFLNTLMMLLVFCLLIITGLQQTLLYFRAINRKEETHQRFYSLEHAADQLFRNAHDEGDLKCFGKESLSDAELLKKLKNTACAMKTGEREYYYYIEDLGEFPCLVINKEGLTFMSHHYQISISLKTETTDDASFLQLRYFKQSSLSQCTFTAHTVSEGISTWRYSSQKNMAARESKNEI